MAESLDPEAFNDFLDSKPGWIVLTTIAPDGYPHSVPLGYFREGDHIYCKTCDKFVSVDKFDSAQMGKEHGQRMCGPCEECADVF